MFNEILTGKASVESTPPPDPYREPAPQPQTLICTSCHQPFPAAQALAGVCRACASTGTTSALLKPDSISYMQAENDEYRKQAWNRAFYIAVLIIVAAGIAAFRYGMREQYREDMKKASGYRD